jgi:hypothetical protein
MTPETPPLKLYDIVTTRDAQELHGCNAEHRPVILVEPSEVPEHLQALIPYAERWAIPCDPTRHDYFDKQPEADITEFYFSVEPHRDLVREWLDSQPYDVRDWPEAAIHFMYMLKAHEEAYQPTPEERIQRAQRFAATLVFIRRRIDDLYAEIGPLDAAGYARVIALMETYEGMLEDDLQERLDAARAALAKLNSVTEQPAP